MGYKKNNNRNDNAPKTTGAKYSKISVGQFKGMTIVNAWNKSKNKGMLTVKVAPYKNSKVFQNGKGESKQTMIAVVKYENSGVEKIIPCSMNQETQVIALSEIGMVITPNGEGYTSTGKKVTGYFGTMFKK